MSNIRSLLFGGLILVALSGFGFAVEKSSEPKVLEASIHKDLLGQRQAHLDFGALPSGTQQTLQFLLWNPESVDIPIPELKAHFPFKRVVALDKTIPAQGHARFEITIDVPKDWREAAIAGGASVRSPDVEEDLVQISFRFQISSMLSFANVREFVSPAPKGTNLVHLEVPMLITSPMEIRDLRTKVDSDLQGMTCRVVKRGDAHFLICDYRKEQGYDKTLVGVVTVTDEKSKRTTSIRLIIESRPIADVTPGVVRFTNKDSKFVAKAFMRVYPDVFPESKDKKPRGTDLQARFSVDSGNLDADVQELANGVYRVDFEWKQDKNSQPDAKLPEMITAILTTEGGQVEQQLPVRELLAQREGDEKDASQTVSNGDEARSYLKGMRANSDAIRSYDWLMVRKFSQEKTPELGSSATSFVRARVDLEKERFLFLERTVLRNKVEGDEKEAESYSFYSYQNGKLYQRTSDFPSAPNKELRGIPSNFLKGVKHAKVVDLRLVGFGFARVDLVSPAGFERYRKLVDTLDLPNARVAPSKSQTIHIYHAHEYESAEHNGVSTFRWVVHPETLTCVFTSNDSEVKINGETRKFPGSGEFYRWGEVNGVSVPVHIEHVAARKETIDEKLVEYNEELEGHIHWFSVNEEMKDEDFSPDILQSADGPLKLLDPVESEATTIPEQVIDKLPSTNRS